MIPAHLKPIEWTPSPGLFELMPKPIVVHLTPLAAEIAWLKATGEPLPAIKDKKQ